ncbi:hypothetical protein [Jiangella muralis]|uniref:hypothetical protein n=1 Tax=Jiangella muralis TaxID=702383 RepID=UPI00069F8BA5|nr:hypothetical protein [Jiangella muralis]
MRLARPAAALLVLGAMLFAAAPASAGGPTSVLLVSPSTGRTASLYATNEAYTTLMSQLGMEPVAAPAPGVTPPGVGGDQVVVTWMVHDIQPWRVDRITFDDDGLPEWIHTTEVMGAGPMSFDDPGVSHQPADAAALADLLVDLGLTGRTGLRPAEEDPDAAEVEAAGAGASGAGSSGAGSSEAGAAEAGAAEAGAAEAGAAGNVTSGGTLDAATWALPAVAGGIVVGVLGDRWLRRRRGGEDGGRWELVDASGPSV